MIKKIVDFQKSVLSATPNVLHGGLPFICFCAFAFINIPVGFAAGITMAIYKYCHSNDSLFQNVTKRFSILNLYLVGYTLFFLVLLTIWCIFLLIGLPIQFFSTGNLDGVFAEMFSISIMDVIEICFSICLYQVSIFYILMTKREHGFTGLNKEKEFLFLFIGVGIIFFFMSEWILEESMLQTILYACTLISIFVLPLLSIKKAQISMS